MGAVNHLAVLVTVVVQMAIGFVWYAEWAFGEIWMEGIGLDPATMGQPEAHVFPVAILGSFAIGYGMAWLLGRLGVSGVGSSVRTGAIIGAVLVGTTLAVHHGFSGHSIPVMFVDAAKEIVTFALVAAVLGAMPPKANA
jgi:hypothetical protein